MGDTEGAATAGGLDSGGKILPGFRLTGVCQRPPSLSARLANWKERKSGMLFVISKHSSNVFRPSLVHSNRFYTALLRVIQIYSGLFNDTHYLKTLKQLCYQVSLC